jgi:hypothetical protein
MIFGKVKIFFFKNNFKIIIASLIITIAINLKHFSQLPSVYSEQGIFQPHFQRKKVCTILDKIWYLTS